MVRPWQDCEVCEVCVALKVFESLGTYSKLHVYIYIYLDRLIDYTMQIDTIGLVGGKVLHKN